MTKIDGSWAPLVNQTFSLMLVCLLKFSLMPTLCRLTPYKPLNGRTPSKGMADLDKIETEAFEPLEVFSFVVKALIVVSISFSRM